MGSTRWTWSVAQLQVDLTPSSSHNIQGDTTQGSLSSRAPPTLAAKGEESPGCTLAISSTDPCTSLPPPTSDMELCPRSSSALGVVGRRGRVGQSVLFLCGGDQGHQAQALDSR